MYMSAHTTKQNKKGTAALKKKTVAPVKRKNKAVVTKKKIAKKKIAKKKTVKAVEPVETVEKPKQRKKGGSPLDSPRIQRRKANHKQLLLEAMKESYGVVSDACAKVSLSRKTFYDYYHNDPEFKAEADECQEIALDLVDSQFVKNIKAGKEISLIFYAKCRGKKRGYIEKGEDNQLVINITTSAEIKAADIV